MAPPRSLAPLRHRRFALLWTGAFVSNIGTWMETVGVGILVTSHTGKAGWAGLVAAAAFVPTALLAPFGGAIADRFPRRTVLVTTTLLQTGFAGSLTLLAATGTPSPGVVTLIVLGAGCANAIGFPSFQALLPDLVPRDELAGAIALTSAQWNLGRVIGPALAGVAIGLDGYELAFGINTLSFFAVLAVVASFQLPKPAPAGDTSILGSIREGARFVRSDPALRIVVAFMACNSLLAAPFIALVPAVALKVFHDEKFCTSLPLSAQGAGAVCMGLLLGTLHGRFGSRRVVIGVLTSLPLALVAYASAPTLGLAAAAIVFVGASYVGAFSMFTTIAQLRAPPELRGRVLSALFVLLGALYPLGSVAQGALADRIGMRVTVAGAALLLLAVVVGSRLLRPDLTAALDGRDAAPSGVQLDAAPSS